MNPSRFLLVADGSSDRDLLPVLRWSVREIAPALHFYEPEFVVRDTRLDFEAELRRLHMDYKPDLLFVHRDAERMPLQERRSQIPDIGCNLVRVVPLRMTEAWLLIDQSAIRSAAGNPNGNIALSLPPIERLETLPDPKGILRELLVTASELPPRRRQRFKAGLSRRIQQVAANIASFAPLRRLAGFQAFEADIEAELPE